MLYRHFPFFIISLKGTIMFKHVKESVNLRLRKSPESSLRNIMAGCIAFCFAIVCAVPKSDAQWTTPNGGTYTYTTNQVTIGSNTFVGNTALAVDGNEYITQDLLLLGSTKMNGDITALGNMILGSSTTGGDIKRVSDLKMGIYSGVDPETSESYLELMGSSDNINRVGESCLAGTYVDLRYGLDGIWSHHNVGTVGFRLDQNGRVGIGTTTLTDRLTVSGTTKLDGNTTINGTLNVSGVTTLGSYVNIGGDLLRNGDQRFDIYTNTMAANSRTSIELWGNAEPTRLGELRLAGTYVDIVYNSNGINNLGSSGIRVAGNGNVGMGTTVPERKLHVYAYGSQPIEYSPAAIRIQSAPALWTFGIAKLEFASDAVGSINEWRPCYIQSGDAGNFNGIMRLFVNNATHGGNTNNEKVRISERGSLFAKNLYIQPIDDPTLQLGRVARNQVEIDDNTGPKQSNSGLTLTDLAGWNLPPDAPQLPPSNHACLTVDSTGRVFLQRECCYAPTESAPPPHDWQQNIDRINQQDHEIQELKDRLSTLEALLGKSDNRGQVMHTQDDAVREDKTIDFYQNDPNPFSISTAISYTIPEGINNAFLVVSSSDGKEVVKLPLITKGEGHITISASDLASGTYFYAVVADGVRTGYKKMVVMK